MCGNKMNFWKNTQLVFWAVAAFLSVGLQSSEAQQQKSNSAVQTTPSPTTTAATTSNATSTTSVVSTLKLKPTSASVIDNLYRIGPGDVLTVKFYNHDALSREIAVSGSGTITMPMLDGDIPAACMTEEQLAADLTNRYKKYFKTPHLDVYVKERNSHFIAVIGEVRKPARIALRRRIRLVDALALADGPTDRAGRTIKVFHGTNESTCEQEASATNDAYISSFRLRDILNGDEKSNPFLQPGDIVSIPDADNVYVVGSVVKPSAIPIKDRVTLVQALAMANGPLPEAKTDKVTIIRTESGGKKEIAANLKDIQKNKAADVELQPDDIVVVGTSALKQLGKSLRDTVAPSVTGLVYRIP
jgi:polysaccharide export outer membrane protein